MRMLVVCGARPNFIKIAAIMRAFEQAPGIRPRLVHTGQHYDERLSKAFFDELDLPRPDVNLEVGSGTHAIQTGLIMQHFEPVLRDERPDAVLVVGDVNSTIACALTAVKLRVPVIHVEAGLRSFDRSMPEEINRVLTDAISDLLFATEPSAVENLEREGIPSSRIHLVGNVMIDTLRAHQSLAARSTAVAQLGLSEKQYALLTLHRPATVDEPTVLAGVATALEQIQQRLPIVFPVHPRTRANLQQTGLAERFEQLAGLHLLDPLGYLDFLKLMMDAAVVLTDSGGIQEETTVLGVPCLTLRDSTERPITITTGTNALVGLDPADIVDGVRRTLSTRITPQVPRLWDGRAAQRITEVILRWHAARERPRYRLAVTN